jgi:pimeloyl-ACP methyl ester carboxylesterase
LVADKVGSEKMPYFGLKSGKKLWYEEKGRGMPIVLLHGWLGSSWDFSNQIDYFSKAYRVFAFDHKGHGKSDRPQDATYTLPEFAEELDQALDKLIGKEKFVLIGHSMGGFISLIYAITPNFQKRLKGLILMSTSPKFKNPSLDEFVDLIKKGEMTIVDRALVDSVLVPICFNGKYIETHNDVIKERVEEVMKNSEHVASRTAIFCADHYNVEDKLERIDVPTLILAGDEDAFISPKEAELMHKKIKNSELKILTPKIGHMIQFEASAECNKVVDEFLKKLQ